MANFFINIEAGIEPTIAFNIFSILADKDCGEIVLGGTRYTKNGNSFNANPVQYEIKLKTEEKPTARLIKKIFKTKAPKQIKRKHHKQTIEERKEYQHQYYMRVTKEKRRKARTEKNMR